MHMFRRLQTLLWRRPVSMEALKGYPEHALGAGIALRLVPDDAPPQIATGERLLIFDLRLPVSPAGYRLRRLQKGAYKDLDGEELARLPASLQELDERCIATVSSNGKDAFTFFVNRYRLGRYGSTTQVYTFQLDQTNGTQVPPQVVQLLLGSE